jgi:hypothetical protein
MRFTFVITLLLVLLGCSPKPCMSFDYRGNPAAFPGCDAGR